jgi:hypothetical protein
MHKATGYHVKSQRKRTGAKGKHIHGGGWMRDVWHSNNSKTGKGR